MHRAFNNSEYLELTKDILSNEQFEKLKLESHHMISSRYDHNVSVSFTCFKIAKFLRMDVRSATRGALLHDFYFDHDGQGFGGLLEEIEGTGSKHKSLWTRIKGIRPKQLIESMNILVNHPQIASKRATDIFNISEKEQNIIKSHMWPVCLEIPMYREGWLVTLVDNAYSVLELGLKYRRLVVASTLVLAIL